MTEVYDSNSAIDYQKYWMEEQYNIMGNTHWFSWQELDEQFNTNPMYERMNVWTCS